MIVSKKSHLNLSEYILILSQKLFNSIKNGLFIVKKWEIQVTYIWLRSPVFRKGFLIQTTVLIYLFTQCLCMLTKVITQIKSTVLSMTQTRDCPVNESLISRPRSPSLINFWTKWLSNFVIKIELKQMHVLINQLYASEALSQLRICRSLPPPQKWPSRHKRCAMS